MDSSLSKVSLELIDKENAFLIFQSLGAKYKRHAAITMPLFRRAKIINNFDLIVDCTDKLLSNWRARPSHHVHCDIVQQCQNLLLQIFGLISFDYDLEALDECDSNQNELMKALQDFMSVFEVMFFCPPTVGTIYTKLSRRYQRAKAIIEQYIYQMIDNEMAASQESRAQRKRTCLIASLVASLQEDEEAETKKSEDDKKGKSYLIHFCLIL
jgi:cytochrome P450